MRQRCLFRFTPMVWHCYLLGELWGPNSTKEQASQDQPRRCPSAPMSEGTRCWQTRQVPTCIPVFWHIGPDFPFLVSRRLPSPAQRPPWPCLSSSIPSKRDIELLLKLIANLNMLLRDENVNVVKKAILTMTQLYKVALQVGAPCPPGAVPAWQDSFIC